MPPSKKKKTKRTSLVEIFIDSLGEFIPLTVTRTRPKRKRKRKRQSVIQSKTRHRKRGTVGRIHGIRIKKLSDHYTLGKKLGKGGFGTAYLAIDKRTNTTVVVKRTNRRIRLKKQHLYEAKVEIEYLKAFIDKKHNCHPHVSCFHEAFIGEDTIEPSKRYKNAKFTGDKLNKKNLRRSKGHLFIVMEYIRGKDLNELGDQITEETVWYMAEDLITTLDDMHKVGILHNDIKPENIMLDLDTNTVKLVDLGLACFKDNRCPGGTDEFVPPEVKDISNPHFRDERSDIYALGLSLAESVLKGKLPKSGNIKKYITDPVLKELLLEMIQRDYHKRPFAKDLIKKYNFER
jgi:serine/threonine protein kinase